MPWLAMHAQIGRDEMYDCTGCKKTNDHETRRRFRCGHISEGDWIRCGDKPGLSRPVEGLAEDPLVCPGYAFHLPQAMEAAEAFGHWSNGQIDAVWQKPLGRIQRVYLNTYAAEESKASSFRMKNPPPAPRPHG